MSLYPSLEDMKVDQMAKVQERVSAEAMAAVGVPPDTAPANQMMQAAHPMSAYPALGDYMGLEFSDEVLALNMPEYLPHHMQVATATGGTSSMVAPLSSANA